jgi:uncharacterized protein YeaO (DUF488 family)
VQSYLKTREAGWKCRSSVIPGFYNGVMQIGHKRWNDPRSASDGWRVLVCRYRPRGLPKSEETWDEWLPDAGPSRQLHAAYYGKLGEPLSWPEYERRYLAEMRARPRTLEKLKLLARRGPMTLLCSSACVDAARCHRALLKRLIES